MPGTFDQLSRKQLVIPVCVVAGADFAAADTPGKVADFVVPRNAEVVEFSASYIGSGGTSPTCQFDLRRGTTVLASAAVIANDTPIRSTSLAIPIFAGETLNINTTVNNTDNTFTGVVVTLGIQPIVDENVL